jgi:ubiquinone/menaquinone biosynthesis C-methylase UbiE
MDPTDTSVESFDRFAKDYEDTFMDYGPYLQTYAAFCAHLKPHHNRLLDIACGPGNISYYLSQRHPELTLQITGVDLSEQMLALARHNLPTGSFHRLDTRNIASLTGPFDVIVCGFGLPYLSRSEVESFFMNIRQLISPQGLIYLSTMAGDDSQSGWKTTRAGGRYYVHYHSEAFLQSQLLKQGFILKETLKKPFEHGDLPTAIDLFLFAEVP